MRHVNANEDTLPVRLAWLPGIALGAVCALLVWPQTHRIVVQQLRLSVPARHNALAASPLGFMGAANSEYSPELRKCAGEHPTDLTMQMAAATNFQPDSNELNAYALPSYGPPWQSYKIKRLQALLSRFPDQPSLYATLLRYTTQGPVRVTRDEQNLFLPPSADPGHRAALVHSLPANVREFDAECNAAERLDPDNGYFPMLHAIALFEAHKDTNALAAIERAAACNHWNEYLDDELNGELKLQAEAFGTPGPLTRATFAAAILLPHLASIRGAAEVALYEAVEAEQAGHLSDGLRIRTAVRRVGSLMRSESRNLIGVLVGIKLVRMSLTRPMGAHAELKGDVFKQKEPRDKLLSDFDAYLSKTGSFSVSESVHAEIDACVKAREIISSGLHRSVFDTDLVTVLGLSIVDMILLSSILWLAAFAALMCVLAGFAGTKPIRKLPRVGRFSLMAVLTFASGTFLAAILIQQVSGSVGAITRLCQMWFSTDDGAASTHASLKVLCDGYVGIVAALPILVVSILALFSLIWRTPVVTGVVRGIRGCALPLCSVLVIGYAVLAPITSAYEARLDARLTESFTHEGRATSRLIGAEWPGRIR